MPEGPSIVILKEAAQHFAGKKVLAAKGNTKAVAPADLVGKKVLEFKSWGKHFLICFKGFTLRIHFLMFGSYSIGEVKESRKVRLGLEFSNGFINFYTASIKLIEEPLDEVYEWAADVMNPKFSVAKARKKLLEKPDMLVTDALLDQNIFSGSGNIIKNEVLFRIKVHPESLVGALTKAKLDAMIKETVNYSFDFLKWKKAFVLKKNYLVYTKKVCPRDGTEIVKEYMGKGKRRTFYCPTCQKLYS